MNTLYNVSNGINLSLGISIGIFKNATLRIINYNFCNYNYRFIATWILITQDFLKMFMENGKDIFAIDLIK